MSNMGNMGNMGNVGSLGPSGAGAGGGSVLPDRVDLPFSTEEAQTWQQVEGTWRWVPVDGNGDVSARQSLPITVWPQRDWNARTAAWLVLDEFAVTDWRTSITLTPWDPNEQNDEIAKLFRAAQDERPDALGEIVAQNVSYEGIMAYFLALMRITPNSHPKTARLLHIAGLVGILAATYFKQNPGDDLQPRPRPAQVHPALLPPVEPPGHPSFPSGHATQALLMARCIEAALPRALQDAWRPLLHTLAGRVARNREIAGLHYESDTHAGLELASQIFDGRLSEGTLFQDVLGDAMKEWQ